MEDNTDELRSFFLDVEALCGRTQLVIEDNDTMGPEYCRVKWENYISIVAAMASALSQRQDEGRLSYLLEDLLTAMERELEKLTVVTDSFPLRNSRDLNRCPTMPSTGGRPAFDRSKEQIEVLRDTAMNWKAISIFLGVSERTLFRRREEYGIQPTFSAISDEDLDEQVRQILSLTPYSGDTYVRGGLIVGVYLFKDKEYGKACIVLIL